MSAFISKSVCHSGFQKCSACDFQWWETPVKTKLRRAGRVSLEHFAFADFFMASHSEKTPYGHLCRPGSKTCHAGLHVDPAQLLYLALHVTWWLFIWLRVCCPIVNRTGRGQGTGNWSWNWIRLIWFYLPYVNGCVHRVICERIYYSWNKCPLNSIFQPI